MFVLSHARRIPCVVMTSVAVTMLVAALFADDKRDSLRDESRIEFPRVEVHENRGELRNAEEELVISAWYSGYGEVTASRAGQWFVTLTDLDRPVSFAFNSSTPQTTFPLEQQVSGEIDVDVIDDAVWVIVVTEDRVHSAYLGVDPDEAESLEEVLRLAAQANAPVVRDIPASHPDDGDAVGDTAGVNCACASCCTCDGKCSTCCPQGTIPVCGCEGSGRCKCVPAAQ